MGRLFYTTVGVLVCLVGVAVGQTHGSDQDSLRFEEEITAYGPGDFRTSARRALLGFLRGKTAAETSALLDFVGHRAGGERWLAPEEELVVRTLIADLSFLQDTAGLSVLLARSLSTPGSSPEFDDTFLSACLQFLRSDPGLPLRRLGGVGQQAVERRFLQLLINSRLVSGIRTVHQMNDQIDRFLEDTSSAPYARIADLYLRSHLEESSYGAGFFLGYGMGGATGSGSSIPGRVNGFAMRGAFYLHRVTLEAGLLAARMSLNDTFSVGGDRWDDGAAGLLGGILDAGYELQTGGALITPFLGASLFRLRQDSAGLSGQPITTGLRLGAALGMNLAYRVKFDTGPHLDLGLRFTTIFPGFTGYEERLDGAILLVSASFGFVGRPYTVVSGKE